MLAALRSAMFLRLIRYRHKIWFTKRKHVPNDCHNWWCVQCHHHFALQDHLNKKSINQITAKLPSSRWAHMSHALHSLSSSIRRCRLVDGRLCFASVGVCARDRVCVWMDRWMDRVKQCKAPYNGTSEVKHAKRHQRNTLYGTITL